MPCNVSEEQLWSWIDRDAPELEEHLAKCPSCRARAKELRARIETVVVGSALTNVRLTVLPPAFAPFSSFPVFSGEKCPSFCLVWCPPDRRPCGGE